MDYKMLNYLCLFNSEHICVAAPFRASSGRASSFITTLYDRKKWGCQIVWAFKCMICPSIAPLPTTKQLMELAGFLTWKNSNKMAKPFCHTHYSQQPQKRKPPGPLCCVIQKCFISTIHALTPFLKVVLIFSASEF